jgi:ribosomal-protein-alanine N-acetyltransferase
MAAAAGGADRGITPMRASDLDEIMAIERVAFPAPWSREVFLEEMEREWAHVDVLRDPPGGALRGFVNYWLIRDEVHVLNVAVDPAARRRGYAARLLVHVVAFAYAHACRYVTLEVRRSNHAAIRLYRKHGFRPVGIRPNYYAEDREDAVVMLLELEPSSTEPDTKPRL